MKANISNVVKKIKGKELSNNETLALKNSSYQITTTIITKIGSLIFTAILARILMPELFGLYSLVFFTIFTFVSFADMGVGTALTRFVSKSLAKGDEKKAKSYSIYLFKFKIFLTLTVFVLFIISAKFIATNYYEKPIFLALLTGSMFVIILSIINFLESMFRSINKFQFISTKEFIFQISRLLLAPTTILILLKYISTQEIKISIVVSVIFVPYLITLIFFSFLAKKKIKFLKTKSNEISNDEKKEVKKFIYPLSISLIFQTILDQIDIILLGKFVTSEFIGYYSAAFFLISPATALTALSVALFPIFSRLKGNQLRRGLKKSLRILFLVSISFTFIIIVFAPIMVKIVYGSDYAKAVSLLRIGSLVIISSSMIGVYINFFISKGKTKLTTKILILLTIFKFGIGYLLASNLIGISLFAATTGIVVARVVAEYFHLGSLFLFSRNHKKYDKKVLSFKKHQKKY